jgi:FixJ family two-component response regulator
LLRRSRHHIRRGVAPIHRGVANETTCVIADIQLGGISGIELRRRLTASGSTLPVIFITATDDETTRKEALDTGCIAYLQKPFPARLLIDAIGKAGD